MSMGKGFAITSNLDLGKQLREGYAKAQSRRNLPSVKLLAIVNDSVATLISFSYQLRSSPQRKAAMGLIVGTGTNATIPLKLSSLHPGKRLKPGQVATKGELSDEHKIVVNTEWSINGAAGPLRELCFVTTWDEVLDAAGDAPGFQPFEYMTSGRYLGELGRLIIVDYFMKELGIDKGRLPPKLCIRNGLATTLLGNLRTSSSNSGMSMVEQLTEELPPHDDETAWHWTIQAAQAVSYIAKAIEVRAAGMTAAAIIGLLACAGEICFPPALESTISVNGTSFHTPPSDRITKELVVGYTGGCIAHFQDYLEDCQTFLDEIMDVAFQGQPCLRVVLHSCQDGGIVGAGVLAGAVHSLAEVT
jgi:hexokinase